MKHQKEAAAEMNAMQILNIRKVKVMTPIQIMWPEPISMIMPLQQFFVEEKL
jgi:hypothetical protein